MLTISGLTKAFGGRTLFADVSLQVNRQDRIGLVRPNGAGKTTLFSLILRNESPDDGEITFERNVTVGYLPQETAAVGDETVLELASAISPEFVRLRRQVLAWEAGHPGDGEFLNQLVASVVEIRLGKLVRYRGNYDDYLEQRDANEAQLLAAYKNQQREIDRLMEFVVRFRAKNTKATQAQAKLKQIERMEKIEAPAGDEKQISFSFPQPRRSGLKVVTLENIGHAYGDNIVYRGMNFQAERGQRIVLVGPNGAGKSTLLKLLASVLPVQSGTRTLGHNVKCGYYSQNRIDILRAELTVLEEALDTPQRVTEEFVRTVLGCFLFRGDDVFKKVSVLSGGEKSRLALVKLLLDPPNLLLMDEPTTHLDIPSIDALAAALDQYQGTLIFISHDVYFIRSLANHVVRVSAGQLTHYPGDYQYYLDKTAAVSERAALADGGRPA